ncbi:MAG: hypothetical protein ACKVRP_02470 [Bacteroidota bacterium]
MRAHTPTSIRSDERGTAPTAVAGSASRPVSTVAPSATRKKSSCSNALAAGATSIRTSSRPTKANRTDEATCATSVLPAQLESDAGYIKLLGDVRDALVFITRSLGLSRRCLDEAAFAALRVIYRYKQNHKEP